MTDFNDLIHSITERVSAGRYSERHGTVTSYDPNNYQAKVMLMPEGIQSGWMGIRTSHIAAGGGMTFGLTVDDQVVVGGQEGDADSSRIEQRQHSSDVPPPPTQSGEHRVWTYPQGQGFGGGSSSGGGDSSGGSNTGQQHWFKNDNSLMHTDGGGARRVMDGKGNYTVSSGNSQEQTTQIVHQILMDKPAESNDSGAGSVGSMLAGGDISSMLGGLLGSGGSITNFDGSSGSTGGPANPIPNTMANGSSIGVAALVQKVINGVATIIGLTPPLSSSPPPQLVGILSSVGSGGGGGGGGGGLGSVQGAISSLQGMASQLESMLNNAMQQVQHYQKLDRMKGIKTSAFQEKHWSTWDKQNGVVHASEKEVKNQWSSNQDTNKTQWNQQGIQHTAGSGSHTVMAAQNVTEQAQNQITNSAQMIVHNGQTNLNGNTSVEQVLTVSQLTQSPVYNNMSDERIKERIVDLESSLDKIMMLRTRRFDEHRLHFDEHGKLRNDPSKTTPMIGFVAQEMRSILPELVYGDESKEFLSVSEGKIGVLLVKAFQEFVVEVRGELTAMKQANGGAK